MIADIRAATLTDAAKHLVAGASVILVLSTFIILTS